MRKVYSLFSKKIFIVLMLCGLVLPSLRAQDTLSTNETFRLPIDKLYTTEKEAQQNRVEIAAKKAQTLEEAPSIVSLITRDQIEKYGARDLSDILRMVPGFEFGVDVDAIFGVGFRGTWAHEGKVLLMINGVSVNDYSYGNLNFFGNMQASMIERVEIIRGPGSVLYGGFAEVAVINIITARGSELNGIRISGNISAVGTGAFSRNAHLSFGTRNKDFEMATHIGFGTNIPSTRIYRPFIDTVPPDEMVIPSPDPVVIPQTALKEANSFRKPFYIILNARWKNFRFNFVRNSFTFMSQQHWFIHPQINGLYGEKNNHTLLGMQVTYSKKLSDRLSLETLLDYGNANEIATAVNLLLTSNSQWHNPGVEMWKVRGEASLLYNNILSFGGGYTSDRVYAINRDGRPGLQLSNDPGDTTRFTSTFSRYAFVQYNNQFHNWNLTAGLRFENTSFGNALLPRAGVVYHKEKLNLKLLFGRSFRIPMPFQAYTRAWSRSEQELQPEIASTLEIEAGYKINTLLRAKANLFFINISNPIVFRAITDAYENYGNIESMGMESELLFKRDKMGAFANFSLAVPVKSKTNAEFQSTSQRSFIGLPPVKINAGGDYQLGRFTFAPTFTWISKRSGVSRDYATALAQAEDASEVELESQVYPALLLFNFNISANRLFKNTDIKLTGFNLLNAKYVLLQPYYDAHAPLPVNDRQVMLTITLKL